MPLYRLEASNSGGPDLFHCRRTAFGTRVSGSSTDTDANGAPGDGGDVDPLLAMVMKAPIWYLLARVSEFTGGDGWHRAYLIDVSVQHLRLWWFAGLPVIETSNWFEYSFSTGADITNNFISVGLNAGLGAIVLLILMLVRGFSNVG